MWLCEGVERGECEGVRGGKRWDGGDEDVRHTKPLHTPLFTPYTHTFSDKEYIGVYWSTQGYTGDMEVHRSILRYTGVYRSTLKFTGYTRV